MLPVPESMPIPSVAELNRDMEPYIIQASGGRNIHFKDPYRVLQFVHFTDVHHMLELWNRIAEYVNTYSEYIAFSLHTGDYCGCSQTEYFCDLYGKGTPCKRPILNCVGNHDTIESYEKQSSTPEKVHSVCFPATEDWGVTFMPGEFPLSYYKEFPESNLRLIVLDLYFVTEAGYSWLKELLDDAREKGIHVITASHEMTHPIVDKQDVTFQTLDDVAALRGQRPCCEYDRIIAAFKKAGGKHVCHLAGNEHSEYFGFTASGVLNVVAPGATYNNVWSDCRRIRGTKTYDCFNVVAVDTNLNLLKLVRIGNNIDHYLRTKRVLCWDYGKQKLIYND